MAAGGVDLLVIGGGITGAGIARDAAMRGLRVGIVERSDFASGTSSRSSKLIHGGIRYLEQGEIGLVREAATERRCLRRIAPHLAFPARMAMPVHGRTSAGLLKLRAGLWGYEKLVQLDDEERHEVWSREETLERVPGIEPDRLQGTAVFTEYVTDDARLTLETIKSAKRHGAAIASYAPAIRIELRGARVGAGGNGAPSPARAAARLRVVVRDEVASRDLSIDCGAVVNAAGPWVDAVRRLGGQTVGRIHLTKGIHLVVARERLPLDEVLVMKAVDRRPVFIVPFGDAVWIGTTDTDYPEPAERPRITRDDVDYLLEATNRTLPEARIAYGDVRGAWAGVRPLVHQEGKKPSEISRRDEVIEEPEGLFSIAGGKLTTYRSMAERVVDEVVGRLGVRVGDCETARVPLVEDGPEVPAIRTRITDDEVAYAIEHECALCVADVLERRARLNILASGNGASDAERVAEILARRLGWDDARGEREVAAYRARLAEDVAWRQGVG
jgi:glycerol-3-phosphate dehydrogenase